MKTPTELCELLGRAVNSGMQDFQRAVNLCHWLQCCERIPGDVVEFGVYQGHTLALLTAMTRKMVWAYDSFQGLPKKSSHDITDAKFHEGGLKSSVETLVNTFEDANLALPIVIPKWFKDVIYADMPANIAFAHIDADLYPSIKQSLALVYPRLSAGAVCVIDDYTHVGLPGVKVAVDEFMVGKPEKLVVLPGHAMFEKL